MHYERALGTMRCKPARHQREACIRDVMEAMALAARISRVEAAAERLNEWLGRKAREIVEDCWPQVVAVARVLLDEGTVSGEDLWDVARSPDPDADPWDAFDDLVLSLKLPKGEPERLRTMITARRADGA